MNVWVVNASPLILLGKINQLPLLAKLVGQVAIPHEVAIEIKAGPVDDPARCWLEVEGRSFVAKPMPFDLRVVPDSGSVPVIDNSFSPRITRMEGGQVFYPQNSQICTSFGKGRFPANRREWARMGNDHRGTLTSVDGSSGFVKFV